MWLIFLAPRDSVVSSGDPRNAAPAMPGLALTYGAECAIAFGLKRLTPVATVVWTFLSVEAFGFLGLGLILALALPAY